MGERGPPHHKGAIKNGRNHAKNRREKGAILALQGGKLRAAHKANLFSPPFPGGARGPVVIEKGRVDNGCCQGGKGEGGPYFSSGRKKKRPASALNKRLSGKELGKKR